MAESFAYNYDVAVRTLVYTRYGSLLGIDTFGETQSESINKGVVVCPKRIAQRYVSEKRGETFLEFFNVYRRSIGFSWSRQRSVVSRRGLQYVKSEGGIGIIKADAVDIEYDVWAWSNSLDKINSVAEKYLQWQHETPKISLTYGDLFQLNPDLMFSPVVDESAIEDIFNTGKVWVFRMPVRIEGWLPKLSTEDIGLITKIQLTLYDKDELSEFTHIIPPGENQDTELEAALRMFRANIYGIVEVDTADNVFIISNDRAEDFSIGDTFIIENSTENNEMYTVVSISYLEEDDTTAITVQEDIPSSVADGNIYKPGQE
jgi:hypothetical protein